VFKRSISIDESDAKLQRSAHRDASMVWLDDGAGELLARMMKGNGLMR